MADSIVDRLEPLPPHERAYQLFLAFVDSYRFGHVHLPEVDRLKREINPSTGLANEVLFARAVKDFRDPEGRIVIIPDHYEDKPFAEFFKAELRGVSENEGKDVIGILLNIDALKQQTTHRPGLLDRLTRSKEKPTIKGPQDHVLSSLKAVIDAQSELIATEKSGELGSVLTRREFRIAVT